ncbi:uncharacterized protein LOC124645674 [Helicoverpa zea]|uniref:uncharacterized protein LOC124645674 n=1 Tax=Helicoverpa zea TaxID=7113 RepID=UPI001F5AD9A2|nr:uncharacterized protein LOC124645674 [Helicoverpa zea]
MNSTMETILDSKTSSGTTSESPEQFKIKAASAPAIPKFSEDGMVKPQLSAPSYLNYMKQNETPPFRKPVMEPSPHIIIGMIMNEVEAVAMIAAGDADKENGLRKFLADFLIEKNITANYMISEKNFLISLMLETIEYAAQRDFGAYKLSVLITIYLDSHLYFKWYYWQSPTAVWNYFKEMMIRHSIEDTPYGEEVFGPEDCYDIVSHFHTVYLTNLPLIHILTFGTPRLKLLWPFKLMK